MDRGLLGHGAIAVVSVVVAYTAWSTPVGESTSKQSGLQVLAGNYGELTAIDWLEGEDLKTRVALTKSGEEIRVRVEREQKDAEPRVSDFPGSKQAEELFEKLRTIEATRSLGNLDSAKRESLALGEAGNKKLTLTFGERTVKVNVGTETYGTRNYYVTGPSDEVFLVDSNVLAALRHGAGVLLDRRAIGIEEKDVKRAVIRHADGRSRELVHRYPGEEQAFFADAAEPDTKLEEAAQWFRRVLNQRVKTIGEGAAPSGEPALRIEFIGEPDGFVELWSPGSAKTALVRTSRFDSHATVNGVAARRLIEDAEAFLNPADP